ncbi:MAG: hypothetical protein Q7S39_11245 [Ignavibacteria bacterium]|nr:hypothetical protein [Ignavibacteria bacterium]
MRQLSQIFAIIFIAFVFLGGNSFAQNNEQPLLIVSFNMVTLADVGKVNKMVDSVFAPILKELVDEGMISGWGQFNHAWGDEWNVNFWYTAKDMASFDKFWDEYVSRVNKRNPGSFAATTKYFQAHKDNIYTIRGQYPLPPQR